MKTTRFFLTAICMLLFFCNTSYAGNMANDSVKSDTAFTKQNDNSLSEIEYNPSRQQIDSVITTMVNALDNEYKLSAEQKELIKKKTEKYAISLLKAKSLLNNETTFSIMNQATQEFLVDLDNVLTVKQKDQRAKKFNEKIKNNNGKSNTK